jgi:hypothetical protein
MPKLTNILNDLDEVAVPTPDGDIHIEYYPSRVTQEMSSRLRATGKIAGNPNNDDKVVSEALTTIFELLLHLIRSWDLEDDIPCGTCELCESGKGEDCQQKKTVAYPLEAERMNSLPVWLITDTIQAVTDPNRSAPKKKKRN